MSAAPAEQARIGGFVPFSACDWPGQLVATVFLAGCPWRCGYCHNPHLLERRSGRPLWSEVARHLASRQCLLDGVVFSGGEPLTEPALGSLLEAARTLGLATGLHTGGALPDRLRTHLAQVDWAGFDFKTAWDAYGGLTGQGTSGQNARRALELLLAHGTPLEVRTTLHPRWHDGPTLERMARQLAALGIRQWTCQLARSQPATLHPLSPPPAGWPDAALLEGLRAHVPGLVLRPS
ncbi:anaerobic ribonucleoside-triphosphate reductase activating protein [Gulbenkiania indica]|uniref:Anaerobic ribonucleoside-triphosphate reductase activating protein n=1 Tax=Gulbenkiania indica TaxID=375574 RepID=A0A0K6GST2_9NEIS|nr:anaerobic ribonucleoside-triphosphate reductase activating protein [Gulbenkiania indica]CUA81790.1 anaerobic ribonucleoside-triphosphate reductase activating protein [Gulbenkiania indica]